MTLISLSGGYWNSCLSDSDSLSVCVNLWSCCQLRRLRVRLIRKHTWNSKVAPENKVHRARESMRACVVQYPGCAVNSVGIFLLAGGQSHVGDRLHRVSQGQQHLALLKHTRTGGGRGRKCLTMTLMVFKVDTAGMRNWWSFDPHHHHA